MPALWAGWLMEVRLVHLHRDAIFCPECNATWLDRAQVGPGTFQDYSTYLRAQGRSDPGDPGELELLRPLLRSS